MTDIEARGARFARLWILIAVVYLVAGVCIGIFMAAAQKLQYIPVHAHVNLLGWVTMGLAGLIYGRYPQAGGSRLGQVHFWGHNIVLPILIAGLIFMFSGHPEFEPVMVAGSLLMLVVLVVFAVNLYLNLPKPPTA
ncbi:MAG: cytochrome-c oxidase [Bacillota bacterium]